MPLTPGTLTPSKILFSTGDRYRYRLKEREDPCTDPGGHNVSAHHDVNPREEAAGSSHMQRDSGSERGHDRFGAKDEHSEGHYAGGALPIVQQGLPPLQDAAETNGVNGEAPSEDPAEEKGDDSSVAVEEPPTTPPNTPDPRPPPNPESIAPGYGGPLKDVPPEKFNSTAVPKSYHSPWDQAITNDPSLSETPSARLPTPDPKPEGLEVATPFGGFEKASRLTIFKAPEVDLNATDATAKAPEFQDTVTKRPTFNRTALGWVTEGAPLILPIVDLAPLMVPESEDL
ncbi:hypothetical protein JZ751_005812 [Albula glossodonta]|uniref:Uncharacterized protein n=1 Tax=Albula glossodonta TaxID=121402 RepID=A0A8T2P2T7_9TELE|nr:hypothetical protein JZ751_005812 [Albula glossodonta]